MNSWPAPLMMVRGTRFPDILVLMSVAEDGVGSDTEKVLLKRKR